MAAPVSASPGLPQADAGSPSASSTPGSRRTGNTDITAPVDRVHLDCVAALAVVRADFAAAHIAVSEKAAEFAADIERLVAGADGWDATVQLAQRRPA